MKTYSQYRDSGIGWMGEIPSHWERLRLKDVSYMYSGLTGKSGDDFRCDDDTKTKPFVPFTNVLNNTRIDFNQFNRVVMEEGEQQNRVRENDLIFLMSSEDYESIAKSAVVVGDPGEVYLNSFCRGLHFTRRGIYAPFVNYQLNAEQYRDALRFEARGFTRINIKIDRVASQFIALPPYDEQLRIAEYLDEKCAAIDKCVVNLEQERGAYTRLKTSIINRAVIRGLDPNVPFRDSGIDWIGKIPAHWKITRVKSEFTVKGRIGWKGLRSDEFETNSYAYLVTGQDFRGSEISWQDCYQINKERYDEDPFIQIKNGDILVTKDGTIGKIAKVTNLDKSACLNSGIFVMRQVNDDVFAQNYLYWLLVSKELTSFNEITKTGATIAHLYQNVFERMPMTLPPLPEQNEIADYLDRICGEIDATIKYVDKQIDAYKRLKKSLINEVVTGKRAV